MSLRKRQRSNSSTRLSTTTTAADPLTLTSTPNPTPTPSSPPPSPSSLTFPNSDLLLTLTSPSLSLPIHVSSSALLRSRYFSALLSDSWSPPSNPLTLTLPSTSNPTHHITVIRLLHTLDFTGSIKSASDALDLLPVALELLFDALASACLRFLEAVPWSDDDEVRVLELAPLLAPDESKLVLARLSTQPNNSNDSKKSPSEMMLHGLIRSANHGPPSSAATKAFVASLLRDYPSRGVVRKVLDEAFSVSLEMVRDLIGKYASPDFRVAGDNEEREAIQRINLHAAVANVRHLHWLIERMVELGVAGNAVRVWGEQAPLAADLQKTFKDDAWKNIAPGLPGLVAKCTFRLANSVVTGVALVSLQVRTKLVKNWLPVLNVCRDIVLPMQSGHKAIYQELEETFLQIISTLPISDAQEFLQQCLGFSTRNVDDCPHLVAAFRTWFRRADRLPQGGMNLDDL